VNKISFSINLCQCLLRVKAVTVRPIFPSHASTQSKAYFGNAFVLHSTIFTCTFPRRHNFQTPY